MVRLLICIIFFTPVFVKAQEGCTGILHGKVYDAETKNLLPYASVFVTEAGKGIVVSQDGSYSITALCPGKYKIVCSFLSYAAVTIEQTVSGNTRLDFNLHPDVSSVGEVTITGQKEAERAIASIPMAEIKGSELLQTRGNSLGESLTSITGVYTLQTGPSIFKPVIHGLHSNRVLILNNGVRLEGQQWGSEHAPEIDPFIATRLSVVKGAASIRYGSDAIGGVIAVDPAPMPTSKVVSGEINVVGASNGRLGVVSGILQGAFDKKLDGLTWRVQGSFRRAGNASTPHYYIENTGFQETNYSGTLAYDRKKYGGDLYYSVFTTKLGIFTGSDASSIADIAQRIEQPRPSTPSYFIYAIARPYQQVKHQLAKAHAFYVFKNKSRLETIVARQQNDRSEYDFTPLNGRENPELFLKLVTHTADVIYKFAQVRRYTASVGFNGITQGNVRKYEMLIPNFRNYSGGIFYLGKWTSEKLTLEAGARYDYRWLRAYLLDNQTAQVITPTYKWQNVTGTVGGEYYLKENLSWATSFGTAWRAPTVNELLSQGVHQSAGDYENGNPNLRLERAYNFNTSLHYQGDRFHVEAGFYNNIIDGYIFLKPDNTFIHTVRGSKPSFTYTQVNARFRGLDLSLTLNITDSLTFTTKESLLYAWNYTIHDYLQLVPANRFENSFRYGLGKIGNWKNFYVSVGGISTARQKRVPANSDFLAPPSGYILFNASIGWSIPAGNHYASVSLSATNIMNVAYRDYMDRFRYYTDEPGRNFTMRVRVPFGGPHP